MTMEIFTGSYPTLVTTTGPMESLPCCSSIESWTSGRGSSLRGSIAKTRLLHAALRLRFLEISIMRKGQHKLTLDVDLWLLIVAQRSLLASKAPIARKSSRLQNVLCMRVLGVLRVL